YGNMIALGRRSRRLDPTRDWTSCDGDEDVRGTQPVWNKHFGLGTVPLDALPKTHDKPWMVGESGGTYYARPGQLAVFNGSAAYRDYRGRNEALAIDLYANIVERARPLFAFFSPAETGWFGLEHLNFGYRDFHRLPGDDDGIWFGPFEEGKPGVQIERLPPYVCTLNPGWDPALPLYRPLPMFEAQQAAQAPDGPLPCPWDRRATPGRPAASGPPPAAGTPAAFVGDPDGPAARELQSLGVDLDPPDDRPVTRLIVDGSAGTADEAATLARQVEDVLAREGTVWVLLHHASGISPAVQALLPAPLSLTDRNATALVPGAPHPATAGLDLPDLYAAEDPVDRSLLQHGMAGPLVDGAETLLAASPTDWSLFNDVPENAKCAAVVLYEHLEKPSGAALIAVPRPRGALLISTLSCNPRSAVQAGLWRRLFANLGIRSTPAGTESGAETGVQRPHDLLRDGPPTEDAMLEQTFTNPIVDRGQDPWVIRWRGAYYFCQSRRNRVYVTRSEGLLGIGRRPGSAVWRPERGTEWSHELWAPELHYLRGRWYIYVAADDGDNANHRMYVLEGTTQDPEDPFVLKGRIAAPTDRWAIDGTVLQMPDQRLYFIWSGWEGSENVAQHLYIAPM
ncbi:MAG: family 43 glycosylhydrolase, partial [Anaerolineae bacterium]